MSSADKSPSKPKVGKQCPTCSSPEVARILYGLPDPEIFDNPSARSKIVLGGCCITDESPRWQCLACGATWGKVDFR